MSNEIPSGAGPAIHGGLVPCLSYDNCAAEAAEFYKTCFGAEERNRVPAQDGKRIMHCLLDINGNSLIINDAFPDFGHAYEAPANVVIHMQVADVQPVWDKAIAAGCTVAMPLDVQFWGDRYGHVVDPYGVRWALASKA
jgi:PhnB protein